ncbi:hypothetical protein D3C81_2098140 [compost metagenome]
MPIQHDAIFRVHLYRARQNPALDIATCRHKILSTHGVRHALGFLFDNRTFIKVRCYIMRGRTDQFHAPFECLMIRLRTFEGW